MRQDEDGVDESEFVQRLRVVPTADSANDDPVDGTEGLDGLVALTSLRDLPPPPMLPGASERAWRRLQTVLEAVPESEDAPGARGFWRAAVHRVRSLAGKPYLLRAAASVAGVALLGGAALGASASGIRQDVARPVRTLLGLPVGGSDAGAVLAPTASAEAEAPVQISARLVSLGDGALQVAVGDQTVQVSVTESTKVEGGLAVGTVLDIEGLRKPDGNIIAARIAVEHVGQPPPSRAQPPTVDSGSDERAPAESTPAALPSVSSGEEHSSPSTPKPIATTPEPASVDSDQLVGVALQPVSVPTILSTPVSSGSDDGSSTVTTGGYSGGSSDYGDSSSGKLHDD